MHRVALVVRPVIPEDYRHDLTQLEVRSDDEQGQKVGGAGGQGAAPAATAAPAYQLALPGGGAVLASGAGLVVYGQDALDDGQLCPDLVEDLITRAFQVSGRVLL